MQALTVLLIGSGLTIMILTIPEVATVVGITLVPETAALGVSLITAGLLTEGVKL